MPGVPDKAYTFDHEVREDSSVAFRCSQDAGVWPWLDLPPWHPVAMQTRNYWVSVECSAARGTFDRDKWSALVWMDWQVGDFDAGNPVRGLMESSQIEGELGFAIALHDAADRLVYASRGKGVVFRTRDFEGWRDKAKKSLLTKVEASDFTYAEHDAVGALPGEFALISSLQGTAPIHAAALVTPENGLPPASRYMGGTGDHVNATHLAECARQFVALLTSDPCVRLARGAISFSRYVELGAPFRIDLLSHDGNEIALAVEQDGKPCTSFTLGIA